MISYTVLMSTSLRSKVHALFTEATRRWQHVMKAGAAPGSDSHSAAGGPHSDLEGKKTS